MKLLLDLGNTRVKWALQARFGEGWVAQGAVNWQEDVAAQLEAEWTDLPAADMVAAASVVDIVREAQLTASVVRMFGRMPLWLRTPARACGIVNAYAEPQRLGVDRFLAMVAAHSEGFAPCVLAGIGTALTLDALADDGRHLGGMIAPGPLLMQQSLLGATAQIRLDRAGAILDLADNTTDAVMSGCWHAAAALIERFAVRVAPRLGQMPTLILGGGDAALMQSLLAQPARVTQDGVLRGLAVWAAAQ
jgi:type III pantothenate kinase